MMRLGYIPQCIEWIYTLGDAILTLAVSDQESNRISIYDGLGVATPLHVFETLHTQPVVALKVSFMSTKFEFFDSIDI